MKRAILLTAAALALAGNASAERCERNEKTRGIATMLAQGASDARTLQSKLPKEWACECHEHEIKAYCNVGAPGQGAFLCCIPKGLSCKTKPSETAKLPAEKHMKKNHWKMCATDHSFCQGEQLILPSADLKKFPDGLDPVCGKEGTKAFEVAKKLGMPLRPCGGAFFDRCECPKGEKKIMRDYIEFKGVAYSQPDCVPEGSGDGDDLEQEAKRELDDEQNEQGQEDDEEEKEEEEEEDQVMASSKSSLRSNKNKRKTEKAFFDNQDKLDSDEKKKSEDEFFGSAKEKED